MGDEYGTINTHKRVPPETRDVMEVRQSRRLKMPRKIRRPYAERVGENSRCLCGALLAECSSHFVVTRCTSICYCARCEQAFTYPPPYKTPKDCALYFDPAAVHSVPRRVDDFLGYARLTLYQLGDELALRGKRLLDFGCGGGELLVVAKALGMDVFGVEINPYQRNYLTEKGFRVAPSMAEFEGQTFDVVVLSHVLEHIPSPEPLLLKVANLLGGGGRLLLSMPNLSSYLARLLGRFWPGLQIDQHIWHFTPKTIAALLERCGYDVEKVEISALGKGRGADGRSRYGGAVALLDTHASLVGRMVLLGLLVIDGLFRGKVGQAIRRYGEKRGGDNMIVVASRKVNAPT